MVMDMEILKTAPPSNYYSLMYKKFIGVWIMALHSLHSCKEIKGRIYNGLYNYRQTISIILIQLLIYGKWYCKINYL